MLWLISVIYTAVFIHIFLHGVMLLRTSGPDLLNVRSPPRKDKQAVLCATSS